MTTKAFGVYYRNLLIARPGGAAVFFDKGLADKFADDMNEKRFKDMEEMYAVHPIAIYKEEEDGNQD